MTATRVSATSEAGQSSTIAERPGILSRLATQLVGSDLGCLGALVELFRGQALAGRRLLRFGRRDPCRCGAPRPMKRAARIPQIATASAATLGVGSSNNPSPQLVLSGHQTSSPSLFLCATSSFTPSSNRTFAQAYTLVCNCLSPSVAFSFSVCPSKSSSLATTSINETIPSLQ